MTSFGVACTEAGFLQVAGQLQALLQEKARLASENARLAHENTSLQVSALYLAGEGNHLSTHSCLSLDLLTGKAVTASPFCLACSGATGVHSKVSGQRAHRQVRGRVQQCWW